MGGIEIDLYQSYVRIARYVQIDVHGDTKEAKKWAAVNPRQPTGKLYNILSCSGASVIARGMTRRLHADPTYSNWLAKNPLHRQWRASWIVGQPFDLVTLLEPLDRDDVRPFARRSEMVGISRNWEVFEELRRFAYRNVLAYLEMGNPDAWRRHLLEEARAINIGFALPLHLGDLRQIARSVAKWTWRKFSRERFSEIQRSRALQGRSLAANSTRALIADAIQELGVPTTPLSPRGGITARDVAVYMGRSERTVRHYAAEPRKQYEMRSLQRAQPWTVEGISRSTWHRNRRRASMRLRVFMPPCALPRLCCLMRQVGH